MTEPSYVRPPIGIEPEFIWKKKRLHDLLAAVKRYNDAGRKANAEWFSQIDELTDDLERKARAAWYPEIDKLINDLNGIKDLKAAMRPQGDN